MEDDDDEDDDAPPLITSREDFENIMDDFLDNFEILGGKMRHVLPGSTNIEKLGTIRHALTEDGPIKFVEDDEESDEQDEDVQFEEDKRGRWDCETILSTLIQPDSSVP